MTSLACVTGRFQPVHRDHLALFCTALAAHDRLVIAVTNPDPGARQAEDAARHRHTDDANPFTYYERARLLLAAVAAAGLGSRSTVVPFDLTRPQHWVHYVPAHAVHYVRTAGPWEEQKAARLADAGYRVLRLPGPAFRSATAVRAALRAGGGWEDGVPAGTVGVLRELLAETPMAQRGTG
ncbi:MAG: cytidyltransferase [Pseudonocardiaceae bacterium]|nr:cytidyltransferase [Pseudonocardiaceae bacterium]